MSLSNLISEIKQNARLILQRKYWILVLMLFVCSLVGVVDHMQIYGIIIYTVSLVSETLLRIVMFTLEGHDDISNILRNYKNFNYKAWTASDGLHVYNNGRETVTNNPEAVSQFAALVILIVGFVFFILILYAFVFLFAFLFKTFLSNPVRVGKNRYLLKMEQGKEDYSDFFFAFTNKGNYLNSVMVMLLKDIFVGLWSLLFVIPGIIKNLSYFMVPYLISENPNMPYKRAFDISKAVMDGEKWNLFVIYLSFLGWILLGTYCTCGIGLYFVYPYLETSMMQYYIYLKNKAFTANIVKEGEIEKRPFHYNNAAFQNG